MTAVIVLAVVSKVPWYVAGAVLAAWAVIVSALGLRSPSFPGSAGGMRVVMAISFVLFVVAIAMSIHSSTFE